MKKINKWLDDDFKFKKKFQTAGWEDTPKQGGLDLSKHYNFVEQPGPRVDKLPKEKQWYDKLAEENYKKNSWRPEYQSDLDKVESSDYDAQQYLDRVKKTYEEQPKNAQGYATGQADLDFTPEQSLAAVAFPAAKTSSKVANFAMDALSGTFRNFTIPSSKSTSQFSKEVIGELLQGKQNRAAIKEGNEWLKSWINHPVTQSKIDKDLSYVKGRSNIIKDSHDLLLEQSKNFVPNSKEYPLMKQLKEAFVSNTEPIHKGNFGVSYLHGLDPFQRMDSQYIPKNWTDYINRKGSWISRSKRLSNKNRISTTIHEGTHDWVSDRALTNSNQFNDIINTADPNMVDKYERWSNLHSIGEDAGKIMGKKDENLAYLTNPTEVHARIMELRHALDLTPDVKVTPEYAQQIIDWVDAGGSKVDPKFLNVIDKNPKKLSYLFNRLWAVPTAVVGANLLTNQSKKEIKAYGGQMKRKFYTGGPEDGLDLFNQAVQQYNEKNTQHSYGGNITKKKYQTAGSMRDEKNTLYISDPKEFERRSKAYNDSLYSYNSGNNVLNQYLYHGWKTDKSLPDNKPVPDDAGNLGAYIPDDLNPDIKPIERRMIYPPSRDPNIRTSLSTFPGLVSLYKKPTQPVALKKDEVRNIQQKTKPSYQDFLKTVNPDYIGNDYNLEEAYKNLPYETMEAWAKDPEKNHLPDTWKLPNHPTFSIESKYYKEGMPAGRWEDGKYIPINKPAEGKMYSEPKPIMELMMPDGTKWSKEKFVSRYGENQWLKATGQEFKYGGPGDKFTYPESWNERIIKSESGNKKYNKVYPDKYGNLTIGDGYNLNQQGARDTIESILGLDYDKVLNGLQSIDDTHIDLLRKKAIQEKYDEVKSRYPKVDDPDALYALMDLGYQFGNYGLDKNYPGFKDLINSGRIAAAANMLREGKATGDKDYYVKNFADRAAQNIKYLNDYDRKLSVANPLPHIDPLPAGKILYTPEEQAIGYNSPENNIYPSLSFPGKGKRKFVPTKNKQPLLLQDETGNTQLLKDKPVYTQGNVTEHKLQTGGNLDYGETTGSYKYGGLNKKRNSWLNNI